MELDELRCHWDAYRATAVEEEILSEEELYALLPSETVSPYWQMLSRATRYVAVYGFLLFCCHSC